MAHQYAPMVLAIWHLSTIFVDHNLSFRSDMANVTAGLSPVPFGGTTLETLKQLPSRLFN